MPDTNIPRDATAYTPTTHVLQRKRYRKNPEIKGWVISEVIETGESKFVGEGCYRFTKRMWYQGIHKFHVVVNPEEGTIISAYCPCHDDQKEDCDYDQVD